MPIMSSFQLHPLLIHLSVFFNFFGFVSFVTRTFHQFQFKAKKVGLKFLWKVESTWNFKSMQFSFKEVSGKVFYLWDDKTSSSTWTFLHKLQTLPQKFGNEKFSTLSMEKDADCLSSTDCSFLKVLVKNNFACLPRVGKVLSAYGSLPLPTTTTQLELCLKFFLGWTGFVWQ